MEDIGLATYAPRDVEIKYPHVVNFIQAQIEAEFGIGAMYQRGFNIYTTLNPDIQDSAQDALTAQVEALADTGIDAGAIMVTDPSTGAIRAMVGSSASTDAITAKINHTLTYQQSGSTIKPVVYAAALAGRDNNTYLTPASILWDVPVTYSNGSSRYSPMNVDGQYHGAVPLRYALQNDYHIAAVKAYAFIGNNPFIDMGEALGLQFIEDTVFGLESALGANEVRLFDMMKVYGTFANDGQRNDLYAIERVTETVDDREVEVWLTSRSAPEQVITPQLAYLMTNILSDDNARSQTFGSNSNLTLARLGNAYLPTQNRVAAIAGTSFDNRDLWTIGYTKTAVVGVWIGTSDNSPTVHTTGFDTAAPVWNQVMEVALHGRIAPEFTNPGGVVAINICRSTGSLTYETCPEPTTDLFIQDKRPPTSEDGVIQTLAIDSWTGLLANEFCQGHVVEQTFANIDDRSAVEWLNSSSGGRAYAQMLGLPIPVQTPPSKSCSQGQSLPAFNISYPNKDQTISDMVMISGQVLADDFARYELSYASAENPENFTLIASSTSQVTANRGQLGEWDSTSVSDGSYIIRLTAYSTMGGWVSVDRSVAVNNPIPTATPSS